MEWGQKRSGRLTDQGEGSEAGNAILAPGQILEVDYKVGSWVPNVLLETFAKMVRWDVERTGAEVVYMSLKEDETNGNILTIQVISTPSEAGAVTTTVLVGTVLVGLSASLVAWAVSGTIKEWRLYQETKRPENAIGLITTLSVIAYIIWLWKGGR